jgi:hypothetical protein
MNNFQAMARIMMLLNEGGLLKPGSHAYQTVRRMVSDKIDSLGPEGALEDIRKNRTRLMHQIKILCMWHKSTGKRPAPY